MAIDYKMGLLWHIMAIISLLINQLIDQLGSSPALRRGTELLVMAGIVETLGPGR